MKNWVWDARSFPSLSCEHTSVDVSDTMGNVHTHTSAPLIAPDPCFRLPTPPDLTPSGSDDEQRWLGFHQAATHGCRSSVPRISALSSKRVRRHSAGPTVSVVDTTGCVWGCVVACSIA